MRKSIVIVLSLLGLSSCRSHYVSNQSIDGNKEKMCMTEVNIKADTVVGDWYVPTGIAAAQIAEAVWLPMYGEAIYLKQPFNVDLRDSIWVVNGSLPNDMDGGVPYIEINGINGMILNVYHTK